MRAEILLALQRGLASCCSTNGFAQSRLLSSLAREVVLTLAAEVAGGAMVLTSGERPSIVGHAADGVQLSNESLVWMCQSLMQSGRAWIIKDHTLEPASYRAPSLQSSLVIQIRRDSSSIMQESTYFWFGIGGAISSQLFEKLQGIAAVVGEWLETSADIVAVLRSGQEIRQDFNRYREEVLSIAHDVRAPLGALRYEMCLADEVSSVAAERSVDLDYVESILSRLASPVGSRCRVSDQSVCNVDEVLERVLQRMKGVAARRNVELKSVSRVSGLQAPMPSIELERVVTNLVGNALKHSRGSRVVLEVREQAGGIRISVSDNGEGFPQDVLTCFASDSERLPSAGDGWGLGLLTSKQRIKDAGGAMTVASLPGAGSIVVISLPRNSYGVVEQPAVLELRDQVPQIAAVQQQKELVLVDDDEEHSASLSRILSKYGIKVRSFSSVEAIAPELSNGEISAIVCDINMPDGGAEALLSRLRTTRCSASVAVISGESDDARLYRLAASGAQAFFGKPVQVEQLVEWVNSLEGDSARSCRYASNS